MPVGRSLLLFQYFTPLLLLWAAQLTLLLVLPVVRGPLYSLLASLATSSLELYSSGEENTEEETNILTFVWNIVMVHLECCGVNDYQDFQKSPQWNSVKQKLQVMMSGGKVHTPNEPLKLICEQKRHFDTETLVFTNMTHCRQGIKRRHPPLTTGSWIPSL